MSDSLRDALGHTPDCPPVEELIAVPEQFEAHVGSCPACQTELAMFHRFDSAPETAEERRAVAAILRELKKSSAGSERPVSEKKRARFFSPVWLGGAFVALAAAVLAVGIGAQWRAQRPGAVPVAETEPMRSRVVRVLSPHGELDSLAPEVTWEPVTGASKYSVTVSEVDDTAIFHKTITSPSFFWPEQVGTLVESGKTVLLNINALSSTNEEIAGSGVIRFHVRPKPKEQ